MTHLVEVHPQQQTQVAVVDLRVLILPLVLQCNQTVAQEVQV
jgi:hypothetical protein